MRRFALAFLICLAVVGTAIAGFAFAGAVAPKAATDTTTVTVTMVDNRFILSTDNAPVGTVIFNVTNTGQTAHDFQISGKSTPLMSPGATVTLTIDFPQPGGYSYLCSVGEHAIHGMQGLFTITGSAATTTATTTGTTTGTTTTTPPPVPTTVKVTEKEFKIILPSTTKRVAYYKIIKGKRTKLYRLVAVQKPVKAGPIHFVIKNAGKLPHNFVIASQQTLVFASGQTGTLNVTLAKGKYKFFCSITGHAALGMKGVLTVN
jgi:uncharacterized cupredoxin-like copper-binding protein